jgi:alpha-mannosidase
VECDWHEIGRKGQGVPQLSFLLPLAFACARYQYDVPFGAVERLPMAQDVPANSWAFARRAGDGLASLQIVSRFGYGFRGVNDSLALTLLRSSYDPDPYPEVGLHDIQFGVCVCGAEADPSELARAAFAVQHPLNVISGSASQPTQASFLALESGSVMISALKLPEQDSSGASLLLRCYEMDGKDTLAVIQFPRPVKQALQVDVHEQALPGVAVPQVDGQRVSFQIGAYRVAAVKVTF